jgi:putative Mg2+ transporter-C (MgtC) family protein
MPLHPTWADIAVRLALTVLAGMLVGINRTERGRAAGMRTTLLVCLTGSLALILANLLMSTHGKPSDSFVQLDMMRLPLGVLTGVGFIGAGTIVRRDDLVMGVTTAATMWFVTMMGMCFGAGQWQLGLAALVIALGVLWLLQYVEALFEREHTATLTVCLDSSTNDAERWIRDELSKERYGITTEAMSSEDHGQKRCMRLQLSWQTRHRNAKLPAFIEPLSRRQDVTKVTWEPTGLQLEGPSVLNRGYGLPARPANAER